jgi:soluble lytic murein transglycosylase-like protein
MTSVGFSWIRQALLVAALAIVPGPVGADIVRLSNGRTMVVEVCRFEGDRVILVLPGGGEVQAHKSLVAEILPDEVPFARTVAIAALAESPTAAAPKPTPAAIRKLVDRVAAEVGLDTKLAHAVVKTESNYEPLAVSRRGAMGLMQLMPVIVRTYDLADPFDPETNLKTGMSHLRRLLRRFDLHRALAAYNAGEGAVARYGGIPPYTETRQYVERILASLR